MIWHTAKALFHFLAFQGQGKKKQEKPQNPKQIKNKSTTPPSPCRNKKNKPPAIETATTKI